MRLLHLTAVGSDVPAATLNFAPRLTVVFGASEAGKSYIIEALDFMFGAARLRDIPQAQGYRHLLLGIDFGADDVVTLVRPLRGGRVMVYDEDIRDLPGRPADHSLAAKHRKDDPETISYYLLERVGLANAKLRKNMRNEVVSMSFRNLTHLILIDEEQMQSRVTPVQTGVAQANTASRSAFKLLIEGEDDSGLDAGEDPAAFRRVNRAQVQVLDRAVAQLESQLDGVPERAACLDQVARINASIQQASASIAADLSERERVTLRRQDLQNELRRQDARAGDARAIYNRFLLLQDQYDADLARLEMVRDAGTLLGYFDAEACVFCGATAEHQQREHAVYETVQLAESVEAETSRTQALRHDLTSTLDAVDLARRQAEDRSAAVVAQLSEVTSQFEDVERRLVPVRGDLDQLLARRSELERRLGLWQRIDDLHELRAGVAQEKPVTADRVAEGVGPRTGADFSSVLRRVLGSWGVPGHQEAALRFDETPDVVLEKRVRADRGKGMRSILHAGFTIALSEFCQERDLPHPGFVALDTPVLTYRDPDIGTQGSVSADHADADVAPDDAADELLSATVAQSFYAYLATAHLGQTLVLENQTPPTVREPGCEVVYFTGSTTHGRSGFYPGRV